MPDCCATCKKELEEQINRLRDKVSQIPEVSTHLFGNPSFSDLRVKAGNTTFYVTKYLMGLKSKIFEETILEGSRDGADNVLRLHEDPAVVEAMLEYICLQKKVKGSELAAKVVQLANRYGIDDLKDQCELELLDNLTFEDAHANLQIAYQEGLSVLYWKCSELIYHNFTGLEKYSVESEIVEQPEPVPIGPIFTFTPDTVILTTIHGKVASDHRELTIVPSTLSTKFMDP
ncbi:unnamed protein product [Bursaphelenchus xylophilus]|uniref:(pine wood nematode) hypothetical protein n=1 Tax=Bursaphelenchus xylophilus TaxID=6326 RepID=A0A1I7S178_BURXY|nr:unnamed protein product [Bursaphelenchus xylophilus]CAG9080084.1 unnamed protein product [Bursaphelenchus xylophilus]